MSAIELLQEFATLPQQCKNTYESVGKSLSCRWISHQAEAKSWTLNENDRKIEHDSGNQLDRVLAAAPLRQTDAHSKAATRTAERSYCGSGKQDVHHIVQQPTIVRGDANGWDARRERCESHVCVREGAKDEFQDSASEGDPLDDVALGFLRRVSITNSESSVANSYFGVVPTAHRLGGATVDSPRIRDTTGAVSTRFPSQPHVAKNCVANVVGNGVDAMRHSMFGATDDEGGTENEVSDESGCEATEEEGEESIRHAHNGSQVGNDEYEVGVAGESCDEHTDNEERCNWGLSDERPSITELLRRSGRLPHGHVGEPKSYDALGGFDKELSICSTFDGSELSCRQSDWGEGSVRKSTEGLRQTELSQSPLHVRCVLAQCAEITRGDASHNVAIDQTASHDKDEADYEDSEATECDHFEACESCDFRCDFNADGATYENYAVSDRGKSGMVSQGRCHDQQNSTAELFEDDAEMERDFECEDKYPPEGSCCSNCEHEIRNASDSESECGEMHGVNEFDQTVASFLRGCQKPLRGVEASF
jgi:hypothetical protein